MKKIVWLACILVLSGCAATKTGVVQIGENTYMNSRQDVMAYSGGVVKAELYKEATAFCATQGKKSVPGTSSSKDYSPYISTASAEIQFRCD